MLPCLAPLARRSSANPYATSPWNLNNLPRQGGEYSSMLRVIEGNVPGEWRRQGGALWPAL